jgi:hypothetical protein
LIWQFNSSSIYSVQSLYAAINNRGVQHVFTPVVWKIKVPPRIHIFLWFVANNKTLTRDNLLKRRPVEDGSCLFCVEQESVAHLFFVCCIARAFWCWIIEIAGVELGSDFESIARFWILGNKYNMLNVLSSVVLWTLWKTRSILCF